MKLKMYLATREVASISDQEWSICKSNGQHNQMPGHVLAEVRMPHMSINLFHPQTDPSTGHIDVVYRPTHLWDGNGFTTYGHDLYKWGQRDNKYWPTGDLCLVQTVAAIETYLAVNVGYTLVLNGWFGQVLADHQISKMVSPEKVAR